MHKTLYWLPGLVETETQLSTSPRHVRLNAFDMNRAGHLSPGLWRQAADRESIGGPS